MIIFKFILKSNKHRIAMIENASIFYFNIPFYALESHANKALKMEINNKDIIFILFILIGTISAIVEFILLCFLLRKKKKSVIFILVVTLVATNCINAISFCFIGIAHFVPLTKPEANCTTPQICILSKPYFLFSVISAKQSPMITCSIAVIQFQNACTLKWERRKLLSKCLAYVMCLLIICVDGCSIFYNLNGNFGEGKISTISSYHEMFSHIAVLYDTIIILLFSIISMLLYISAVLIIRSKFSSTPAIRQIQSNRQKAILRRLKIIVAAQLLHSCIFVFCTFFEILSFSTPAMFYLWCFFPFFKAGNSIVYANILIPVIDKFKELYYNLRKLLNSLYNSLFHCVHKISCRREAAKGEPTDVGDTATNNQGYNGEEATRNRANKHAKKHNICLYAVIINLVIHRRNA
ncbi:hypothetical protein T10_12176 [Trichinella papuae]|uniref:Uncharacterized protein n=1 Tax=Trichinella papuae TaxID=268474 RepID=A0A0V1MFW8_9BILA|nr:hypothetical protein T10_12176 [Trichinella papuae]